MTVGTEHEPYLAAFEAAAGARSGEPASLARLRRAAIDRFSSVGFPSKRDEEWKYTGVTPIVETPFAAAPATAAPPAAAALRQWVVPGARLAVFVDGRHAPALSHPDDLPDGTLVESLAEAVRRRPALVEPHLGTLAGGDGHAFVSLNTALFRDGAFVHLPRGATAATPIQLLFVATGKGPTVAYPRTLIVVEEAAEATVIETFASLAEGTHFTCAATEVVVGQGARLRHYRVERESEAAYHIATQASRQERDSSFSSHAFTLGGGLVRNDVVALLDGEGGNLVLNGLYFLAGAQHVDTHMRVEHRAARCESHELYKGVLDGKASAVFNGLIHVHPGAQKTNAKQSNRNLLLSRDALANSNPQLRIFADDVKCTHGSTVGQLDEDAVFYLRSRGIGRDMARSLLTWAFAREVVEGVAPEALRAQLEAALAARMPVIDEVRALA